MRWFALAVFVWLLAFLACLGALLMSPQEDEVGKIAVEHSAYCDQFVVRTKQGYVTLIDTTGNLVAIAGARQISGRLYTKGVQRFTLDGLNCSEYPGGGLAWVTQPKIESSSARSSGLLPRLVGCSRSARAGVGC